MIMSKKFLVDKTRHIQQTCFVKHLNLALPFRSNNQLYFLKIELFFPVVVTYYWLTIVDIDPLPKRRKTFKKLKIV